MPLSQPIQIDGDGQFTGFVSRQNPTSLPAGTLQYAGNMRLDRGVATTRKGTKRMISSLQIDRAIYAAGVFSLPSDGIDKILLAGTTRLYVFNTQTRIITSFAYPLDRTCASTDGIQIIQANDKAYILRGEATSTPKSCTITYSSGLATVTCSQHGFATNDEVTILGADQTEYNGSQVIRRLNGAEFSFTSTSAPASPATGTILCVRCKPALVFDGTTVDVVSHEKGFGTTDSSFPPASFGAYASNRLVVRTARDTIAVSDYLDFDTWDQTLGIFELNLGDNDEIVGFTPWDDKLLVFKRHSIYIAYLQNTYDGAAQADLGSGSYVTSVTDQVGCSARQTIANAGQNVYFLSDSGVRVLTPQLDLKLLGNSRPLSDPISDIIERISIDSVSKSVGKIFNNRYYLAVPLDGSTYNNAVLVYNLLNEAWESVDTYPDGVRFDGLVVAKYTRAEGDCDELDPGVGCMAIEIDCIIR